MWQEVIEDGHPPVASRIVPRIMSLSAERRPSHPSVNITYDCYFHAITRASSGSDRRVFDADSTPARPSPARPSLAGESETSALQPGSSRNSVSARPPASAAAAAAAAG